MKRAGLKIFIALFLLLAVVCGFDNPGSASSTPLNSYEAGSFCGIMHRSIELAPPPLPLTLQADAGDTVKLPPAIHPGWLLAKVIDHPSRMLGRPI